MSEMEVPKGWKITTFADIVKNEKYAIKRGPWGSSIKKDFFVPDGYKVYQQHNVIYDDFEFGDYFLDEKKFDELKEFEIKSDDILISCSGTIGKVARVPPNVKKGVMNQALLKISPDDLKINSDFFLYLLKSPILQNKIMAKGTAMKNIVSVSNLKKISFNVPMDLKIQKQIVAKLDHILGELEEKKKQILTIIENNKKRIDYFEKNWLSYVIDREIEHHPNRKNWELKKLVDSCELITSGGTPSRSISEYFGGNIPWLKIGDLNNDIIVTSEEKITQKGLENSSAKLFPVDTVLIAMYGATIGKTGILSMPSTTNQAICGMVCKSILLPNFLHYFLKSQFHEIRKQAEGGAQPNINQNKIKQLVIPIPSVEIQKQIVKNIKSAEEKLQSQKQQFQNIKDSYESTIKHIEHIQSSILDTAFSGKLVN